MTEEHEDREEERGEAPYRAQDSNTTGHGNLRNVILFALALGTAALLLGLWLGN